MIWLLRQFLLLRKAIWTRDPPRQLALGLACGVMLGLIPKGNLLAVAVASVLFATRMNIALGMLSALVFSVIGPWLDPLTHRIGLFVLTPAALAPTWRWLESLPLAAWTSFNNTVVMGSFVLSATLFYPVYRFSLPCLTRYQQHVLESKGRGETTSENDAQGEDDSRDSVSIAEKTPVEQHLVPRRARPATRRDCA